MKQVNIINTLKKAKKAVWTAYMTCFCAGMNAIVAYAEDGETAKKAWDSIINAIKPFILALGGLLIVVGGINMAIGFKSEDSDGITRGVRTLIAGAGVLAVVGAAWGYVTLTS